MVEFALKLVRLMGGWLIVANLKSVESSRIGSAGTTGQVVYFAILTVGYLSIREQGKPDQQDFPTVYQISQIMLHSS